MKRLRTFLLCLLMAALPLQGLAAVVKASCGPAHHGLSSATVAAQVDHHHAHAGGAHHDHHDHHDQDRLGSASSAASAAASPDGGSAQADSHASSYCSACAACCTGAVAPPSAALSNPSVDAADNGVPSAVPLVAGFIPAGLEHPPKRIFA
jgi:hypothetical protein